MLVILFIIFMFTPIRFILRGYTPRFLMQYSLMKLILTILMLFIVIGHRKILLMNNRSYLFLTGNIIIICFLFRIICS
jgi:hypothetical protein